MSEEGQEYPVRKFRKHFGVGEGLVDLATSFCTDRKSQLACERPLYSYVFVCFLPAFSGSVLHRWSSAQTLLDYGASPRPNTLFIAVGTWNLTGAI